MMGGLRCDERERLIKGMILEAGWCWIILFSLKKDVSLKSEQSKEVMAAGNEYVIVIRRFCLTVKLPAE